MVGHVQRRNAEGWRGRVAGSDILARSDAGIDGGAIEGQAVKAARPPPLPLDTDEAELCARLRDAMAKPPRRQRLEAAAPPDVGVKPPPTPPELVAVPAPLPPLRKLPLAEIETGASNAGAIKWLQRSRRQRLSAAIQSSPAWVVTIGVIGVTLATAMVMTVGINRSIDLAYRVGSAGAGAMVALRTAAGL